MARRVVRTVLSAFFVCWRGPPPPRAHDTPRYGETSPQLFDRRKLMLVTQTLMAILAAVLAVLTFRGLTVDWPIYLLTAASAWPAPSTFPHGRR